MASFNPYAADERPMELAVPEYSMPRGSYAAPALEAGDAYNDEFGWAPELRTSASGDTAPSAQRLGAIPRFDVRPEPTRPAEEHWRKLDADEAARHSVEDIDANGWTTKPGVSAGDKRWAPNPRSVAVEEPRVTSRLSPSRYSFARLFDQLNRVYPDVIVGSARTFNGTHFSMADHRRTYEPIGAAPVRSWRNTYRMEPTLGNVGVTDMPADNVPAPNHSARIRSVEVPTGSRSWRLG